MAKKDTGKPHPLLVPLTVAVIGTIYKIAIVRTHNLPSQINTPASPSAQVISNLPASAELTVETETYMLRANSSSGILLPVVKGETLKIRASGKVHTHPNGGVLGCDLWTEPNGLENCYYVNQVSSLSQLPFMALIGEYNGSPELIGSDKTMTFATGGILQLKVNDWIYEDNTGTFEISVIRNP